MTHNKITWLSFLMTLSALTIPTKVVAHEANSWSNSQPEAIENRLNNIAKVLQQKEQELSQKKNIHKPLEIAGGWGKGNKRGFANRSGGGSFVNRSGGGGFLNNSGWRDGGGFLNRSGWNDRGGFINHRSR